MRRGQRCRSNWSRRAGARPVCGPFEREEAVDRAAAVPPSRSKCIIVYNDRKVRERLCDGCQKVTSAQRHDLNLHVEKTITLNDAFPVEHRVNTFVQHARQSSRMSYECLTLHLLGVVPSGGQSKQQQQQHNIEHRNIF